MCLTQLILYSTCLHREPFTPCKRNDIFNRFPNETVPETINVVDFDGEPRVHGFRQPAHAAARVTLTPSAALPPDRAVHPSLRGGKGSAPRHRASSVRTWLAALSTVAHVARKPHAINWIELNRSRGMQYRQVLGKCSTCLTG